MPSFQLQGRTGQTDAVSIPGTIRGKIIRFGFTVLKGCDIVDSTTFVPTDSIEMETRISFGAADTRAGVTVSSQRYHPVCLSRDADAGANLKGWQRNLLTAVPDSVYSDTKQTKSVVAVRPKPPFWPVFRVAASREGFDIRIINQPLEGSSVSPVETGES